MQLCKIGKVSKMKEEIVYLKVSGGEFNILCEALAIAFGPGDEHEEEASKLLIEMEDIFINKIFPILCEVKGPLEIKEQGD